MRQPRRWMIAALLAGAAPILADNPFTITGTVLMPDGSPPPEPVVIERHCTGRRHIETKTDSRGRFSFRIGGDANPPMIDATVSQPREPSTVRGAGSRHGLTNLSSCDVRAVLSGFESQPRVLGLRSAFDPPDIGIIVLQPVDKELGRFVSVTTLNAPPAAKKAYQEAQEGLHKKKPDLDRVVKQLEAAVEAHPEFAVAWHLLGVTQLRKKETGPARKALRKAVESDKDYLPPYLPLIRIEMAQSRWKEVAALAEHAVKLDPNTTEARFAHAISSLYVDRLDDALASALYVQKSDDPTAFPQTHHVVGMIYADRKDYHAAAREFESLIRLRPQSKLAQTLRKQLDLWAEQGLIPTK